MHRVLPLLFVTICFIGCSGNVEKKSKESEIDGGTVKNSDRDKAEEYFAAFKDLKSAEDEEKLMKDFGKWLETKEYYLRVELKDGKHNLSCPYFPPVTPWTDHRFFDVKNLNLLPQLAKAN